MTSVEITPAATAVQSKIEHLWNERVATAERMIQAGEQLGEVEMAETGIPSKVPEDLFVPAELIDQFNAICDGWVDRPNGRKYVRSQQLWDIVYFTSGDTALRKWAASRLAVAAKFEAELASSLLIEYVDRNMNYDALFDRLWTIDDAIMQASATSWDDVAIKVDLMKARENCGLVLKEYHEWLARDIRSLLPEAA